MVVPDICPREKEFTDFLKQLALDLKKIVNSNSSYRTVFFSGSGTSVMDACINSVVPSGEKIAIINNGAYGERMVNIAKSYRISYVEIATEWGKSPDLEMIRRILERDSKIACLAMVHHETSTGMLNPLRAVGKIAKINKCTFIVDAISSFAGIPINIRDSKIDFLLATANKCLHGLPGVAFVICRYKALQKIKNYTPRSYYLNLYQQHAFYEKTGQIQFTPPVQVIYALREALNEYFKMGVEERFERYKKKWTILRKGLNDLGFKFFLDEKDESQLLLTVLEPGHPNFSYDRLHDLLYENGFTIYPGRLKEKKTFRLAVMGEIDEKDIKNFLTALKESLLDMGVIIT